MSLLKEQIVIVDRQLTESEENELSKSNSQIYLLNGSSLKSAALQSRVKKFDQNIEDFIEKHIQRVISFGHQAIIENDSIAEILKVDSSSLWYYIRFSLFHRSRNALELAEKVMKICETSTSESEVLLYSNTTKVNNLLPSKVQVLKGDRKKKNTNTTFLINYVFLFTLRSIYGLFRNLILPLRGNHMIIANNYLVQKVIDPKNGKIKEGDPHIQSLIDQSLKTKDFVYLTQLRPPSLEANHKLELSHYLRKREYGGKSIYFEPYLLRALLKKDLRKSINDLNSRFGKLRRIDRDGLSKEHTFLLEELIQLEKTLKLTLWRRIASSILFREKKVESISCIDEHSLQNRSILEIAQLNKVKTAAIQHGAISKSNVAYRFVEQDISFQPFLDLSLLRGKHTFKDLVNNYYPESKLKVVGHPRTDCIPILLNSTAQEKLIAYATQPMLPADNALKRQQLEDFKALCKAMPDYQFILKPHPNESEIADYYQMAKQDDLPNLEVYEGELYYLLAKCEILITDYSTVGIEALYFNKELISLDYLKRDLQGYIKAEVAHRALNGKELIDITKDIVQGNLQLNEDSRKAFIADRAFQIDGKATDRIFESIDELTKGLKFDR